MVYTKKEGMSVQTKGTQQLRHRAVRFVDLAVGFANAAVLGLSVAFSNSGFSPSSTTVQDTLLAAQSSGDILWETLGSEAFVASQREYAQRKLERELAEAERLKAEAEGLKEEAAVTATATKDAAERSAQIIRLYASYDGVEQRYHRPEGFVIRLNYPTMVEKEETEFGYKATARPTTDQGTVRVYVNLASVNEGYVPANASIGTVGKYPVGEGVKAF